MAVINKSITLQGATAKVVSFTVYPQTNGSYVVTVAGTATDGAAFTEQLATTLTIPAATAVLDNMSARALTELRKANGLET